MFEAGATNEAIVTVDTVPADVITPGVERVDIDSKSMHRVDGNDSRVNFLVQHGGAGDAISVQGWVRMLWMLP